MNPYDGYQLYQVQRTRTRAEIIADDARRGRQAAAVLRGGRTLVGEASRSEARGTACGSVQDRSV
jgi:hypothetical protein